MGGKEQTRAVAEQGFGCGPSAIGSARLPCARLSPESMGEPRHRTPHVVSWGGGGDILRRRQCYCKGRVFTFCLSPSFVFLPKAYIRGCLL